MLQLQNSKAQAYRRKATMCDDLAGFARSTTDRTQLLRMRDALLANAAIRDGLDGPQPMPPANANALTARHA
jgi:hypothetical protein